MNENKIPLRRMELSLTKFNEVAIPHHLELLRQYRTNILKFEKDGNYSKVRTEQTHAQRVVSQLSSLLADIDGLRRQVRSEDSDKFDKLIRRSRDSTLKAITDYLGMFEQRCGMHDELTPDEGYIPYSSPKTTPLSINRSSPEQCVSQSACSTESVGIVDHDMPCELATSEQELIQLQIDDQDVVLKEREAVMRGWCELQNEVRALHEVWTTLNNATRIQQEQVVAVASSVNTAAENVQLARTHLLDAERLRASAYGAGGAALGALVAGPLGLLLGVKAAACAGLAGCVAGYIGARVLGSKMQRQLDTSLDTHEKRE